MGSADEDEATGEGVGLTEAVGKLNIPDISPGGLAGTVKGAIPTVVRVLSGVDFHSAPVKDLDRKVGRWKEEAGTESVIVAIVVWREGVGYVDVVIALNEPDGLLGLRGAA